MNFDLTNEQKEAAKQAIIKISKHNTVLNDKTGNFDWLKKAASDIENGLPVREDMLKGVLSLALIFDMKFDEE